MFTFLFKRKSYVEHHISLQLYAIYGRDMDDQEIQRKDGRNKERFSDKRYVKMTDIKGQLKKRSCLR